MIQLLGEARKFSSVLLLGLLALVFLAECLTLTVSFESPTASWDDPWYVRVAAFAPDFVRAGTAAFGQRVARGRRRGQDGRSDGGRRASRRRGCRGGRRRGHGTR